MSQPPFAKTGAALSQTARLDSLDATRAFALILGIVFHASLSFMPVFIGWAVQDVSTSPIVAVFCLISHSFRMELFFLLAGFFTCLTLKRKTAGEFIRGRLLRIVLPFVVGWFILRPLLVSGWIMGSASLRGDYDFFASVAAGYKSLETLPAGLFTGSHLWFLYYLALFTTLALLSRALLGSVDSWRRAIGAGVDAAVAWLAHSPWAGLLLALPTAAALCFMRFWGMDTPDQSLKPHLPVLFLYGGCFVLGWCSGRRPAAMAGFADFLWLRAAQAGVGLAGVLWLAPIETDPSHAQYMLARVGHALSYGLMMWSLVFLTLGLFQRLCTRPQAAVRYVADASYWLYLVHLPLVIWLQVAVAELQLHWSLKLTLVTATTLVLALLTYDLFVRSTWLGQVLNGRRHERAWRRRAATGDAALPVRSEPKPKPI